MRSSALLLALTLASMGVSAHVYAEPTAALRCTVRSVHDGDSLRVQCPGERRSVAVRLRQLDAPELEQPYGRDARDHLRRLCPSGTAVIITRLGRDQYGRLLSDLDCGGVDVNHALLSAGSAWIYDRHVQDRDLYQLQSKARSQGRGLWAKPNPQAPWRWRYQQRNGD